MPRLLAHHARLAVIFTAFSLVTGCQTHELAQNPPPLTDEPLPDFSPRRAEREAAHLDTHKQPPDFSHIDIVTIVPASP